MLEFYRIRIVRRSWGSKTGFCLLLDRLMNDTLSFHTVTDWLKGQLDIILFYSPGSSSVSAPKTKKKRRRRRRFENNSFLYTEFLPNLDTFTLHCDGQQSRVLVFVTPAAKKVNEGCRVTKATRTGGGQSV